MREQNNVIDKETEAIKKEPNRNPGAKEYNEKTKNSIESLSSKLNHVKENQTVSGTKRKK